jgi:hypothetical protein
MAVVGEPAASSGQAALMLPAEPRVPVEAELEAVLVGVGLAAAARPQAAVVPAAWAQPAVAAVALPVWAAAVVARLSEGRPEAQLLGAASVCRQDQVPLSARPALAPAAHLSHATANLRTASL